jgi:hypothetical protein
MDLLSSQAFYKLWTVDVMARQGILFKTPQGEQHPKGGKLLSH